MTVDPTLPYSDALEMREIRRRLTALERDARMPNSGILGGWEVLLGSVVNGATYAAADTGPIVAQATFIPPSGRIVAWWSARTTITVGGTGPVICRIAPKLTGAGFTIGASDFNCALTRNDATGTTREFTLTGFYVWDGLIDEMITAAGGGPDVDSRVGVELQYKGTVPSGGQIVLENQSLAVMPT